MKTLLTIAMLSGALLAAPAQAQNMGFLRTSVISNFNPQDMKLLQTTLNAALNDPQDGKAHDWKNDKTSASGTITVVKTYTKGTVPCRDVDIVNRFRATSGQSVNQFCQDKAGAWKLGK